jgi:type I restriction enzyme S subunit
MRSGQPGLNAEEYKSLIINIPQAKEQQKITNFLSAIDKRIQTLVKKKTLLEQYKKGVMQKIFKQELRFKDDDGAEFYNWKLKRIGKVFKERNEKNFKDMELLSVSISKGIYSQSESNKKDNSNSDKSKYKRVLKDDIAYNSMRMWQGASAVSEYDGIVSPAYTILEGNEYQYSIFYGYLFKMSFMIQTFQKNSQGLTSDTWNLKYPMISKIKINVPSLEEQTKIANFLSAIDRNIELVTKKIIHTKAYKKGLLQQMFV